MANNNQTAFVTWSNTYRVGVALVDEQHQGLFETINTLAEFIKNTSVDEDRNRVEMMELIKAFRDYADFHFTAEEKELEKKNYSRLEQHKKLHAGYIANINRFHEDVVQKKPLVPTAILATLTDWLTNHILTEDKRAFGE